MADRSPWRFPQRFGYGEAVQAAGTVVAPLLAGFTIALIGLVVDASNNGVRYRDFALLVLMGAAASLVVAIQCAYSARQFMVTPDQIAVWWPGLDVAGARADDSQLQGLRQQQHAHRALHRRWAGRFRNAYHLGVVLVLVGLAIVLIPPDSISPARGLAIAVAVLAAVGEATWVLATIRADRRRPRRLGERPSRRARVRAKAAAAVDRVTDAIVPSYPAALRQAASEVAQVDALRRLMDENMRKADDEPDGS